MKQQALCAFVAVQGRASARVFDDWEAEALLLARERKKALQELEKRE